MKSKSNSTNTAGAVAQERLVRLFVRMFCLLSNASVNLASWADRMAIGSDLLTAYGEAMTTGSKEHCDKFFDALYARTAMMPEMCCAKMVLSPMFKQVKRRQSEANADVEPTRERKAND